MAKKTYKDKQQDKDIAALKDEVESLKLRNISQGHRDAAQDSDINDLKSSDSSKADTDKEQSELIAFVKKTSENTLSYLERVDSHLGKLSTKSLIDRIISVAALIGVTVLAIVK